MSIKGKKTIRSWEYQNQVKNSKEQVVYWDKQGREQVILSNRNIITGQNIEEGHPLKHWQEFVVTRQENLEEKLQFGALSSEQRKIWSQIDELLKDQKGEISDTITRLMMSATYVHYNKGFFDGMKLALSVGSL